MASLPRVGDQFDRYRIDHEIGRGGMGVVLGATDLSLHRQVALKVVSAELGDSEEFLRRFDREATLLARLDSPHVIEIYDHGEHEGCPYIATQYVAGGDLGGQLRARGPMPPRLAATLCAQVADALADAHRAGVVHRDIKPSNVLLRDATAADLHVYLCDFGIARAGDEADHLTAPGAVAGTWSYLSPECGEGREATPASDLYSLGCLFWAALTGTAPYVGSDVEIAIAHQTSPVRQLTGSDDFTRWANAILARSMAKDPADRYPDAEAMRQDLLAAAATPLAPGSGITPVPVPAPATPTGASGPSGSAGSGSSAAAAAAAAAAATPGRRRATGRGASSGGACRGRRPVVLAGVAALAVLVAGGTALAVTTPWSDDGSTSSATGEDGDGGDGGDGAGGAEATEQASAAPEPPEGPIAGDIDADGLGDAVSIYPVQQGDVYSFFSTSLLSDGEQLEAQPERDYAVGARTLRTITLADVDGNGLSEVVSVYVPAGRERRIYVAAGLTDGGEFGFNIDRPSDARNVTPWAGDVDGDGLDDLLLLAWEPDRPYEFFVAHGQGEDGFGEAEPLLEIDGPGEDLTPTVEAGDYDGDGLLDVVVSTSPDPLADDPEQVTTLYLGTGDGFDEGTSSTGEEGFDIAALAGDVDADGDDELVSVSGTGEDYFEVSVRGLGEEGLGDPVGAGVIDSITGDGGDLQARFTLSDVDGDGRVDLLAVGPQDDRTAKVLVVRSDGERFGDTEEWASWSADLTYRLEQSVMGQTVP
ncbi:serine/threonine-protein kinase [Nocardioides kribbensis]|uniref:serine/threonine-protein kinase n=2 Tax=Nocardioides kribbensis TaxID=305517 RepID=UPI0032D9DCB6